MRLFTPPLTSHAITYLHLPTAQIWSTVAPLCKARASACIFVVNGQLHVACGGVGELPYGAPISASRSCVEVYDAVTNAWTVASNELQIDRCEGSACVVRVWRTDAQQRAQRLARPVCRWCGVVECRGSTALLRCARCKTTLYCSRQCQQMDFSRHKKADACKKKKQ
jgi:hypothetical protein